MWFSRSGSRKGKDQLGDTELPLASSKPLLEPPSRSRESSPTKAVASPSNSTPGRPEFSRAVTTPPSGPYYDLVLTEVPTRLSASSSAQAGRTSGLLQAPQTARSQRNPSTVNLVEEDLEGTDRLFDPFTGRPLAVLNSSKQEPLQSIPQGDTLGTLPQGDSQVDLGAKHRSSGDLEDPVRQKMWDYLARIRSLQAEVAAMHLTMDGHALGDPWGARSGMRSRSGSVNFTKDGMKTAFPDTSSTKIPTATLEPVLPKLKGDGNSDEEARERQKEKAAEEFGELEKMFEKKQEALKSVMIKLKELSSVVRTYHELENPVITAARQDTADPKANVFVDSPTRVEFPAYSPSPQETLKPLNTTNKNIPRLTLAPILTSSPGSSLPPSPLPPQGTRSPIKSPGSGRRSSLEMGTGGGHHGYIPILGPNAGPSPLPSTQKP
ncbi:hypothetical protein M408DRAFT_62574 [Serendipita vermifera MAFF 305830]|uniref:Uncharacterized protein n=1 Tax=Serendipita vermifera MAFF 305830 TaxID=933852 RepID=A0A0C2X4I0_SERVB|nr:hypothetical protein M408DRAFT_62574 [Serendipita vermifera MAFF 305830]